MILLMESVVIFANPFINICMKHDISTNQPVILETNFAIGNVVNHTRYNFRAVVIDVDGSYQGKQSTLDKMSEADRPSADQPWYHLLVHGGEDMTYVAECMLYSDTSSEPVIHPMIENFLTPNVQEGCYQANELMN